MKNVKMLNYDELVAGCKKKGLPKDTIYREEELLELLENFCDEADLCGEKHEALRSCMFGIFVFTVMRTEEDVWECTFCDYEKTPDTYVIGGYDGLKEAWLSEGLEEKRLPSECELIQKMNFDIENEDAHFETGMIGKTGEEYVVYIQFRHLVEVESRKIVFQFVSLQNSASILENKDFTQEEKDLVQRHIQNDPDISWENRTRAWRDENGNLCICYKKDGTASEAWFHYNAVRKEWW